MATWAQMADQLDMVVLAYILAFTPWIVRGIIEILYAKNSRFRNTQLHEIIFLCGMVAPVLYLCFYSFLQYMAKDYKEMFTAVIAIYVNALIVYRAVEIV